jgi:Kef-type K+ transport system membrane component KefB/Trk K+ transport system NAD-binding subunit
MEEHNNFLPLLSVLLLAFIVPLLLGRVRWLPVIVGEIIAGIIIGQSGFGLVEEGTILDIIGDMGLAFLMFLAGMEIDFRRIFPENPELQSETDRSILRGTPLVYGLTLALAVPGGFFLNRMGLESNPWLLAFILSATSLGVVLPILKQRDLLSQPVGQVIFYNALLSDFLTVILLTFFVITLERGLNVEVLSVMLLFLAFFVVYRLGYRFFRIQFIRNLLEDLSQVTVQIKVRGAVTVLMAFVVLAGMLGVEFILGAFLAGMIVSLLRSPGDHSIVDKLEAFGYGFFIPVFFIMVGVTLNLRDLFTSPQSLLLLPLLFVIAILVKTLPLVVFRKLLSPRGTFSAASLLNTHLSIEIAVVVIGARIGLLSPAANVTIILFAALTVLIMPILFNLLTPPVETKEERTMLIFGAEDLGRQVARVLTQHGERVQFLEPESHRVQLAEQDGYETIHATSIQECLKEATEKNYVQALLALSSDDTRNLLVCYAAKQLDIDPVIALWNDPAKLPEYRSLGVTAINPSMYEANMLAMMARQQDIFRLLTTTQDDQDIREVHLRNPLLVGEHIRSLGLPNGLSILAIGRNGDLLVPRGYTRLELDDRITLFGNLPDLHNAANWMEGHGGLGD